MYNGKYIRNKLGGIEIWNIHALNVGIIVVDWKIAQSFHVS